MKNFKEIAEKCLAGELSGTFVFQNGQKISSSKLQKYDKDAPYDDYPYYISHTCNLTNYGFGYNSNYNVIDFISDNMVQKKIEIDIPEGKVPVMEQTEKGVVITWKEKELTYDDILESMNPKLHILPFATPDSNPINDAFFDKVNILRKLTNIRNYFGKPKHDTYGHALYYTIERGIHTTPALYPSNDQRVIFDTKEHAEQAIKMLGDELKYLFEPW